MPLVVKNLLIINGLFYLGTFALRKQFNIDLVEMFGLHYFRAPGFHWYQLFTYMFLHSTDGFTHILFNMLALWSFGTSLENTIGSRKFLSFYLAAGLFAAFVEMAFTYFRIDVPMHLLSDFAAHPGMQSLKNIVTSTAFQSAEFRDVQMALTNYYNEFQRTGDQLDLVQMGNQVSDFVKSYYDGYVVIGASGGIAGILAAFTYLFPNSLILIYFFPVKAKYLFPLYAGFEIYMAFVANPSDHVAHVAHLGGMFFGFVVAILFFGRFRRPIF